MKVSWGSGTAFGECLVFRLRTYKNLDTLSCTAKARPHIMCSRHSNDCRWRYHRLPRFLLCTTSR